MSEEPKCLTVEEMIEELKLMPPKALLRRGPAESFDVYGTFGAVEQVDKDRVWLMGSVKTERQIRLLKGVKKS
jgi:hypothetical protein